MHVTTRNQLLGFAVAKLIQRMAVTPCNGVTVTCSSRSDQDHALTLAFKKGIQANRGSMHEEIDIGEIRHQFLDAVDHAACWILGCGGYLANKHRTIAGRYNDIGERAANIGRYSVTRHRCCSLL